MKRRTLLALAAAAALPALTPLAAAQEKVDAYSLRRLRTSGGAETSLGEAAAGDRLVVVVMKGTWCPVCIGQLQELAARQKALGKLGARVVGLTHEAPEKARAVVKGNALPFDVLSDPNHAVLDALGLWRKDWDHPLPSLLVFDRCGIERASLPGRAPGVRPEKALLELLRKIQEQPERCSKPSA